MFCCRLCSVNLYYRHPETRPLLLLNFISHNSSSSGSNASGEKGSRNSTQARLPSCFLIFFFSEFARPNFKRLNYIFKSTICGYTLPISRLYVAGILVSPTSLVIGLLHLRWFQCLHNAQYLLPIWKSHVIYKITSDLKVSRYAPSVLSLVSLLEVRQLSCS